MNQHQLLVRYIGEHKEGLDFVKKLKKHPELYQKAQYLISQINSPSGRLSSTNIKSKELRSFLLDCNKYFSHLNK